jgi:hypothetical protein
LSTAKDTFEETEDEEHLFPYPPCSGSESRKERQGALHLGRVLYLPLKWATFSKAQEWDSPSPGGIQLIIPLSLNSTSLFKVLCTADFCSKRMGG